MDIQINASWNWQGKTATKLLLSFTKRGNNDIDVFYYACLFCWPVRQKTIASVEIFRRGPSVPMIAAHRHRKIYYIRVDHPRSNMLDKGS